MAHGTWPAVQGGWGTQPMAGFQRDLGARTVAGNTTPCSRWDDISGRGSKMIGDFGFSALTIFTTIPEILFFFPYFLVGLSFPQVERLSISVLFLCLSCIFTLSCLCTVHTATPLRFLLNSNIPPLVNHVCLVVFKLCNSVNAGPGSSLDTDLRPTNSVRFFLMQRIESS